MRIVLFFLFFVNCAFATIVEVSSINQAVPYITQDAWFLVDLDNCLFEAKQACGHADWFYVELQKNLDKGLSRDEAIKETYPLWLETQKVTEVKPLEAAFVTFIQSLQSQGVTVMGLTHRQPVVAESTLRQVKSLSLDFSITSPSIESFDLSMPYPSVFYGGVLFVGDYQKKSAVLTAFFNQIQKTPSKVVFIDDKLKNVEDLDGFLTPMGIDYTGLYYTAIQHQPKVYDKDLADFQYDCMHRILSNEEAKLLINTN